MKTKFCINCGTKLPGVASFCSCCGAKQISVNDHHIDETDNVADMSRTASVERQKQVKTSTFNAKGLIPLIRNSIVLLVAIAMLVMAFMPITKFSFDRFGYFSGYIHIPKSHVNISPIRAIDLMFTSMKINLVDDREELYEDLYDNIEDLREEHGEAFDDLNEGEDWEDISLSDRKEILAILDMIAYESYKVGISMENTSTAPQLYIAGIASFVYIAIAIALFVMAVLNLLSTFNIIKSKKGSIWKWTATLLAMIPATVVLLNYLYYMTFPSFTSDPPSLAGTAVATLIISGSAIFGIFVLRLVFTTNRSVSAIVKRSIVLAVSVTVICLAFTPVLKTSVKAKPSGSDMERTFDYTVYAPLYVDFGYYSDEEWEAVEEYYNKDEQEKISDLRSQISTFSHYDKSGLRSESGAMLNQGLVRSLYCYYLGDNMRIVPILMLAQTVAIIGAAFIMWQMLCYLASGTYNRAFVFTGRILATVFGLIAVAVNVTLAVFASSATVAYMPSEFEFSITPGIFFFMGFAIVMSVFPLSAKHGPERDTIPASMFDSSRYEVTYTAASYTVTALEETVGAQEAISENSVDELSIDNNKSSP